jgi:signal transduction histidine kinase
MSSSRQAKVLGEGKHDGARSPSIVLTIAVGIGLLALSAVAVIDVVAAHGRPFPSLLTDPYGSYSAISWPTWGPAPLAVRFPDRVVAVDGVDLPRPSGRLDLVGALLRQRIAGLAAEGRPEARLTFATSTGNATVARAIRRLGGEEELFFFVLYALVGVFVLWSGVAVLRLAQRRAGAIAYACWSVCVFVFLVTFYDYHTTTRLSPLFSLSTVGSALALLWLAYSFPEPPSTLRRVLYPAMLALTAAAVALAAALVVGPRLGRDVTALRVTVSASNVLSLLALAASILVRLRRGQVSSRQELNSAVWGMVGVPAALSVGFALTLTSLPGARFVHLVLPFLAPLAPLSIGYSLIRHNILGTTSVLTPRMFAVPVMTGASIVALVVWLGLAALLRRHEAGAFVPWMGGVLTVGLLGVTGYRLSGRVFFVATAKFRPTLQQLADDLASKREVPEISLSIEEAVRRWLPTESARVFLPGELHRIPERPPRYRARLAAGEAVWTTEAHWHRHLLLPMRSQGELRGVMVLAPKHESALYTREDLELLETIASLGAVALHNADVIGELEAMRRFEVDAARDDKRLALGTLGAEISHEIAYPLNFLRYLLAQGEGDAARPLDRRDLEIGREEIGRLERMFATLRKLRIPAVHPEPTLVLPRVRRALDLIRETLQAKGIAVTVDVPPDLTVDAEPDPLVQIFANLLRNAAQAVSAGQAIGVSSGTDGDGAARLEVWDEGPGFADEMRTAIFNPFVTTKEGSMGLGLAVTERLVRGFGWTIAAAREGGRTVFRIEIPPGFPREVHAPADSASARPAGAT